MAHARLRAQSLPWSAEVVTLPAELLGVGVSYMQELREKALSVSRALRKAGVPHAVIGGLAVAAHVARVDPKAQRNTQDLDILLDKSDLDAAKAALDPLGYRFRKVLKLHAFMPKERGTSFVDGVHVFWAGEKVREDYLYPTPDIKKCKPYAANDGVQYIGLIDLLIMKLTSFRHKDITHIQDLMAMKLITPKIEAALPVELKSRMQTVKDDTEREEL